MIELFPSRTAFIEIFGFEIRWYGVLYVVAFWLAYLLLPRLQKYRDLQLTRDRWIEIIAWAAAGVLLGGRLGYVLFYEPVFFLAHPAEIIALWQGGMSAHGGFIGVAVALWYVRRRLNVDILALLDVATVPIALGLALGRVGNFINQELYTNHAYPIAKNLIIAAVSYAVLRHQGAKWLLRPGSTTIIFLFLYSVLRFTTEYVRIQEWPRIFGLTRGQILTVLLLFIGLWVVQRLARASKKEQVR